MRGKARVDAFTGANYFEKNINEMHRYVVKNKPDMFYKNTINKMLKPAL